MYGTRGWTAHHNTDIWRHSGMVGDWGNGDPVWATWAMAGPWLAQHLYEHYLYGGDLAWLRDKAYPVLSGAAEFGLDWLVDDGKGHLVTAPSTSPENKFRQGGQQGTVSAGATMDLALMRDLFSSAADAAEALGVDDAFRKQLLDARARLRPYAIGSKGQLLEWSEEFEEVEPHHRHFSHLWGLHPGRQITAATPELFAAVRRSLERRGDEGTGWSLAWKISHVGAPARRRSRLPAAVAAAHPRRHERHELSRRGRRLRQPLRRPPAVPDRRQLRRHRRHRRDAAAEPRRRDPPAARAAVRLAHRPGARAPRRAAASRST